MKSKLIALGIKPHQIIEEQNGKFSIIGSVNWSAKLIENKIPVALENVFGNFDVSHNQLASLQNAPKFVFGLFNCSNNLLTSLENGPEVCTTFRCIDNPDLMNLDYAPLWTKECQAYFEKTKVANEVKEIHHRACQLYIWNPTLTWDENMKIFYKEYPLECKKWKILDDYFSPNRGGFVGENTGIL